MHGPTAPRTAPVLRTVVMLHAQAPAKPAAGQACNGCGLCCAWQPCPLGVLVSRRRQGACDALWWDAADGRYRCALLSGARRLWPRLPRPLEAGLAGLARRWIAAGIGCDCELETEPPAH